MPAVMARPAYLSPQKIANALDITRQAVYNWLRDGKIDSVKIGSSRRISEKQLAKHVGEEVARDVFDRYAE